MMDGMEAGTAGGMAGGTAEAGTEDMAADIIIKA
jgi:hypothetical protein